MIQINRNHRTTSALKLMTICLSSQNRHMIVNNAFQNIKQYAKVQHAKIPINKQQRNKELYYEYVAKVLEKKEEQLINWQKQLQLKQSQFNSKFLRSKLLTKIKIIQEVKSIQDRMKKLGGFICQKQYAESEYLKQYVRLSKQAEQQCKKLKYQIEEQFKDFYQQINTQKILLRKKLSQFAQLSAYQKYLNQLHDALETRQEQILKSQQSIRYLTQKSQSLKSEHSHKKRYRIFDNKKSNNISKTSQRQIQWEQNQTFAEEPSKGTNKNYDLIKIQENQASPNYDFDSNTQQIFKKKTIYHSSPNKQKYVLAIQNQYNTKGVQYDFSQNLRQIQNHAKIAKFVRLWLKFCIRKNHVSWKKIFGLYLWRINAVLDEDIPMKFKNAQKQMDNMWGKHKTKLDSLNLLSRQGQSIKRINYNELYVQFQHKKQHRKQLQRVLISILRNRNRKQRLYFYYYFIKFYKHSKAIAPKTTKTNNHQLTERSQLSNIYTQQKIFTPHSKIKRCQTNRSITPSKASSKNFTKNINSRSSLKQINNKNTNKGEKQNKSITTNNSKEQIAKLKHYIEEKQRIEKLLATQCVKMQGLIKMSMILSKIGTKVNLQFFNTLTQKQFQDRIGSLSSQINSLQFRLELILTKCRLGLANNNNKLSTLENLLGFTNLMK